MGVTVGRYPRSLSGFETGLHEHPLYLLLQTTLRSFYLKQMLLRRDWEQYFPKNNHTGVITQLLMAAGPSQPMKNYHSTKLEFLALKWAITEHFKEYLLYQPFLVRITTL